LWYIRELWWFSVYIIILSPLLNSRFLQKMVNFLGSKNTPFKLLTVPVLILSLLSFWVFPTNSEGYRIAMGFSFLVVGYLLGWNEKLWFIINKYRRLYFYLALLTYAVLIWYFHAVYKVIEEPTSGLNLFLEMLFSYFNRWCWILMILGYASEYLQRNNKWIAYLNQGVYPYYILHQTILIVVAYVLSSYSLGAVIEPIIVILATFIGCAIGYEIIRHFKLTRLLFGLKII